MTAGFAGWVVEALIASTLLMGFVLLVRGYAQRAVGAQLAYWLWALPVLRMALPPLPADWRESAAAPISAASASVLVYFDAAPAPLAVTPAIGAWAVVAACWAVGALGFFAWHGAAHLAYVRRIIAPPARREALDARTTLVESDAAIGPVAFGVFRRFVAVPRDFAARYDPAERRLALAHELGHHARGDLIANWIGLAVLAAHWFNPLAWVAYRKFRADQEMANDARVAAALPPIERHAYACAIVKAAHGGAVSAACHLHTIEDLKGRLRMLKTNRRSRRVLLAGGIGIAGLTLAGLGLTASGAAAERIAGLAPVSVLAAAPRTVTERRSHIVIVRDGQRTEYEGADADAYIAAHPEMAPPPPPLPSVPGVAEVAPVPQVPDMPAVPSVAPVPPMPLGPIAPDVARGSDCGERGSGSFVINERKHGPQRTVVCEVRIQRYANDAARHGMLTALDSLNVGRAAILHDRNLTDLQRAQALAGIEQARASIDQARAGIDQARAGIDQARAADEQKRAEDDK